MVNKDGSSYKWVLYTLLFMSVVIGVLGLISWNPLVGGTTLMLLMLTLFVGSFIKAYICQHENGQEKPNKDNKTGQIEPKLDIEELKRSQRLLRYATAILALLSLMTTAEGMKSFVFDETWMAYLGSFAVQSILVVFSLLLCRFYVHVSKLLWPQFIKKVACSLLVAFFCIFLVVSSTFSFSYIANNAYQGNWLSDSEMIIQTQLTEAVHDLQRENNHRGDIILESIRSKADGTLATTISVASKQEKDEVSADIKEYVEVLQLGDDYSDESVVRSWDLMYQSYPQYIKDIDLLSNEYDTVWLPKFENYVKKYNTIVSQINSWDAETVSSNTVDLHINDVSSSINQLKQMIRDIENWKSHKLKNDISAQRSTYQSACSALIEQFNTLAGYLEHIRSLTEELSDFTQNSIDTSFNSMMSKIYLIGVDDTISVADISKEITDLALKASADENFSSEDFIEIMDLRDLLVSYSDYKELEAEITNFINSNIQNNYQIIRDTDKGGTVDTTDSTLPPANKPTDATDAIDESEWRETRSNDFNEFYKLVKSLPVVDDKHTSYDETEVILEVSQIHRDLLGDATEFEKAFSFFKYRFPFMAYFSAFIAVFFDLGSFFTGCFLYVTEFFETKKKEKGSAEEGKPDQNDGSSTNTETGKPL